MYYTKDLKTERETTEAKQDWWPFSAFVFWANRSAGAQGSFFLFRSVSIRLLVLFSHKPKSRRPDRWPLFFFSCPRPNVSRLRRPGTVRAQPWLWYFHYTDWNSGYAKSTRQCRCKVRASFPISGLLAGNCMLPGGFSNHPRPHGSASHPPTKMCTWRIM